MSKVNHETAIHAILDEIGNLAGSNAKVIAGGFLRQENLFCQLGIMTMALVTNLKNKKAKEYSDTAMAKLREGFQEISAVMATGVFMECFDSDQEKAQKCYYLLADAIDMIRNDIFDGVIDQVNDSLSKQGVGFKIDVEGVKQNMLEKRERRNP